MRPLEIPDFSTPLRPPPGRFQVWTQGRRGADVVATRALAGGRLAFAVADEIGRREPRAASGIAEHLTRLLALGASPATALAVAAVELQLGVELGVGVAGRARLVALFAGIADRVGNALTYASAGRETGLLLAPNGTYRFLSCGATVRWGEAELAFREGATLAVVTHPSTVRPLLRALRGGEDPGHVLVADATRNATAGVDDGAAIVVRYAATR